MANSIEGYLFTYGESQQSHIYCLSVFCVLTGRRFAQYKHKGDLVLYTLRLYNISDATKEVLLGAVSPEEIAEWRKAFTSALEKPLGATPELLSPAGGFGRSFSSDVLIENDGSQKVTLQSTSPSYLGNGVLPKGLARLVTIGDDSPSSNVMNDVPGDGVWNSLPAGSVSKWRLVRCENGLRYFEEIPDTPQWKLPVMKSVGVVKAPASHIFDLIMSYGPERSQWDHTIQSTSILETIDGHSDIIHICFHQDWLWLRPRDVCISRYWMREENGAYAVFYRSVPKFPIKPCHIRALINSGGYIVTPLKCSSSGKPRSLVEYVLEMDTAGCTSWMSLGRSAYPAYLRDTLLSTVAGIREYFAAQRVDSTRTIVKRHIVEFEDHLGPPLDPCDALDNVPFLDSNDLEEFYDATMDQLSDTSEGFVDASEYVGEPSPAKSTPRGNHLPDRNWSKLEGNVPEGPKESGNHCYSQPDSHGFKIKGPNYLLNRGLVPAGEPICRLFAVDFYKGQEKMDHIAANPQNLVQKAVGEKDLFFFVVNLQVPQVPQHSLVFYFATQDIIPEGSLFDRFIKGDDNFRNSKLTLIPAIAEGSWIIKQAVGSRAVIMAQILETSYHSGTNYIEVDLNLGSSGVVRGVLGLVFSYITALVVDMAFLLRGDTEDELPEHLLGVVRCSRLQMDKAKLI